MSSTGISGCHLYLSFIAMTENIALTSMYCETTYVPVATPVPNVEQIFTAHASCGMKIATWYQVSVDTLHFCKGELSTHQNHVLAHREAMLQQYQIGSRKRPVDYGIRTDIPIVQRLCICMCRGVPGSMYQVAVICWSNMTKWCWTGAFVHHTIERMSLIHSLRSSVPGSTALWQRHYGLLKVLHSISVSTFLFDITGWRSKTKHSAHPTTVLLSPVVGQQHTSIRQLSLLFS